MMPVMPVMPHRQWWWSLAKTQYGKGQFIKRNVTFLTEERMANSQQQIDHQESQLRLSEWSLEIDPRAFLFSLVLST